MLNLFPQQYYYYYYYSYYYCCYYYCYYYPGKTTQSMGLLQTPRHL